MALTDKQITDDGALDPGMRDFLTKRCRTGELSCAEAFHFADQLGVSPAEIGRYADHLKLHLIKCQLGLFGYEPEKKIVKPAAHIDDELDAAIQAALVNDRLPCAAAWAIAASLGLAKMTVSAACEALGVKVKPCQLGAF
jgi:hypothetical protein